MNTSYYAKYKGENAVSIAVGTPTWFKGRQYNKLFPSWELLHKHRSKTVTNEEYTEMYTREVLDNLDAKTIYEELGEDAVLLCWEKSSDFCHRHIIASWFERELGITVSELL